ncbi:MAG: cytochrome c oxidase accessory protein CcoG [Burkholderiales bacterium]
MCGGFVLWRRNLDSNTVQPIQFYEKKETIVPKSVKGKFRSFKTSILLLAYAVYFGLPWLPWMRNGHISQAIMFDMIDRRFDIFDVVIYPKNVFWLALLLFIAATFLFFVTTLIGRAFCGYFCFQTIWTDLFIWIERVVQGERTARLRLQKQPWHLEKITKIGLTHALWLAFSFWTGMTFVLYFGYAPDLLHRFFLGNAASAAYITALGLTVSTYLAAGFMREQICAYVCPYGRFQSVMYDASTLAVAYDVRRGEGQTGRTAARGELKNRDERLKQGHGDCIDCGLCVQVCPAGIDIREGLQYRCISCGLCIDACNSVMGSVGYPQGLIRYDSEANLAAPVPAKPHLDWKRLKVVGYLVALIIMTGLLVYNVEHRSDFEVGVRQVRQPLFVYLSDGEIRDRYQIRLQNDTEHDVTYRISAEGLPSGALDLGSMDQVLVHGGRSVIVLANVAMQADQAEKYTKFSFIVHPVNNPKDRAVQMASFNSEKVRQ